MPRNFEFHVNPAGPISVYVQIQNQVRFAIASGRLKPGDTLPSARDLAAALQVNSNTVIKAYRDLGVTGLIGGRRGVGVQVLAGAREASRKQTEVMVEQHLVDAAAECLAAGLPARHILKLATDTLKTNRPPYSPFTKS